MRMNAEHRLPGRSHDRVIKEHERLDALANVSGADEARDLAVPPAGGAQRDQARRCHSFLRGRNGCAGRGWTAH
jgi:hypothetical protein